MIKYAIIAAIAAVLGTKYARQPPPYDDGAASIIRVDARLLAGNAHGAPFPPVYKGKWALNDRLTKATRLFEGQVEGSESVATLSDGTLLTVDKYGWVWTCVLNLRVVLHAIDAAPARWRGAPDTLIDFHTGLDGTPRGHKSHEALVRRPWAATRLPCSQRSTLRRVLAQGPPEARHGLGSIGSPRQRCRRHESSTKLRQRPRRGA